MKVCDYDDSAHQDSLLSSFSMNSTGRLVLLIILAASFTPRALAHQAIDHRQDGTYDQTVLDANTSAAAKASDHSTVSNTPINPILHTSDIATAIEKFKLASSSKDPESDNQNSVSKVSLDDGSSNERSSGGSDNQLNTPETEQRSPIKRKLVRSHYRLRSQREPGSVNIETRQSSTFSNFSQPFDSSQQQLSGQSSSPYTTEQNHYLPPLGRALGGGPSSSSVAPSSFLDAPASYSYLAAPGPPQRVASALSLGGDTQGVVVSGGGSPSSYSSTSESLHNQDNGIIPDNYVTVARLNQQPSSNHLNVPSISRMYHGASGSSHFSASQPADLTNHYMAAPSSHYPAYSDYYGSGSSMPSSVGGVGDYHHDSGDHYVPRNYSSHQPDYDISGGGVGHPAAYDYMDSPLSAPRTRWSWPWTDVSNFGFGGGNGGNSMNTAATFKKHHHHHHYHPKHKEHLHHHEGDEHMMAAKWEHGITVGEIVCVAVAVVLGIIILGSPFFLLFLMLFNGGNLFGATQMGLLAPAAVQASSTPTAGRRRRRRSADGDDLKTDGKKGSGKVHASDLVRVGEYLFEQLSPFMDANKLMRTFERIMDVKDGIDKLVSKIDEGDKLSETDGRDKAQSHQHIEMRKRKR